MYRLRDDLAIVQTVDFFPPVVDDPFIYGQIAATNAISDVYAMGGTPLTALNLVAYPDNELGPEWLGKILQGGAERCAAAGCTIVGGHSVRDAEIKFGLAVTGTVHPQRIYTNAGAKPGDVLVLTKPLGTGFVTTAAKRRSCPDDLLAAACSSMIFLNASARDAMIEHKAHAATDVTGFGMAGHCFEMATGSGATVLLRVNQLPLIDGLEQIDVAKFRTRASKSNREYVEPGLSIEGSPEAIRLEAVFDAQTSGGLLIAVPPEHAADLIVSLQKAGTPAAAIVGEIVPRRDAALVLIP